MMRNISLPSIKEIEKQIKTIEGELLYIPKGEFYVARNGKYIRWRTGGGINVSKKKRSYASKLRARKYYEALLGYLKKLMHVAKVYDTVQTSKEKQIIDEMHGDEAYFELLQEYFGEVLNKSGAMWMDKEYDSNQFFSEKKIIRTISGIMVRSKSEMIIADALTRHGIVFRYEYPLDLGGHRNYPDFTILSPRTHKAVIWEHFGLMNDKNYRLGVWHKMEDFCENGYTLGVDFIYSMESDLCPLDDFAVEEMIQRYLL